MKQIKLLVAGLVVFASGALNAQNQQNKWLIGVGAHAVDHSSVNPIFSKFFKTKNWSIVPPLSKLTISRTIADNLAVDMAASVGEIDNSRWNFKDEFFLKAGLGLRFYPFSNTTWGNWFDPYLRLGANYNKFSYKGKKLTTPKDGDYSIEREHFFVADGGLGFNVWIVENFGINLESNYNWAPQGKKDYLNFFQHSAGLVFRFGNKKEPIVVAPVVEPTPPPVIEPLPAPVVVEPLPVIEPKEEVVKVNEHFKNIFFGLNKAVILPKSKESIEYAIKLINQEGMSDHNFCIYGYTDSATGTPAYNYQLSKKRANAVRHALIEKGVDPSRLAAEGLGPENPIASNHTKEGQHKNRRVEIEIRKGECKVPSKATKVTTYAPKKSKGKHLMKKKPFSKKGILKKAK